MCRARSSALGAQREIHLRSKAPEAPSPPPHAARLPLRLPRRTQSQGTRARGHTQSGILWEDELQETEGLLDSKALTRQDGAGGHGGLPRPLHCHYCGRSSGTRRSSQLTDPVCVNSRPGTI